MNRLAPTLFLCLTSLSPTLAESARPDPRAVLQLATRVADWQIETFDEQTKYRAISEKQWARKYKGDPTAPQNHPELGWINAVFYAGLDAFRDVAKNPRPYTDWLVEMGDNNDWRPWYRVYYADDHAVGMTWLSLYEDFGDPDMLKELKLVFDYILKYPKTGNMEYVKPLGYPVFYNDVMNRWGWSDALFMAPPVWARMAKVTGDSKYLDFLSQEYRATYDLLWSDEYHFFYRDSRFKERFEANGQPIFWSRGNGWVFSGLALTIPHLLADWSERAFFEGVFRDMADALAETQRADGSWSMGLLGDLKDYPVRESSGTALFTHGLAWGINNGLLDRAQFEPVVLEAWAALADCVNEDGIFGYVQPVGASPTETQADKTELYAVGAFLLSATEVYKMVENE